MKHILDPSFKYVPSHQTDISKTFARVRNELQLTSVAPRELQTSELACANAAHYDTDNTPRDE